MRANRLQRNLLHRVYALSWELNLAMVCVVTERRWLMRTGTSTRHASLFCRHVT